MNNIELVNASAGSGKTYNLTSRVVEILKNGTAPESLMVTTFTKRAAAELGERIRAQLLKNGQTEEANRINDGFIGTVNSICARLLKEYALEAGISPSIEIMPEENSAGIFKLSSDHVIELYADQMEPAARRMELNGVSRNFQVEADWRDYVRRIVDFARDNQITPDGLKECARSSWETLKEVFGDPVARDLDKELHDAVRLAVGSLSVKGTMTKTTQGALDTLKECEKKIANDRLPWSDWVRLAKLNAARDGQDIIDPVRVVADHVLRHPLFQADMKGMIEGAFDCAIGAIQEYEAYKQKHGLMDFIDQETRVLELALHNDSFRSSLRGRIKTLLVDEFQDTSPIQLALFLALNELAGKSVWVGDPKQAIFGFRGTDPQLMEEVISLLGESMVLDFSWRSKENLLHFTNALFCEVFHAMGRDKVCLKVPAQRAVQAIGGCLEAWHLMAKNVNDETLAAAIGVRDLLLRNPSIMPGVIAVLCRTNDACKNIAAGLERLGVRASVGQGTLLDARECQMALAAMRYMNNQNDVLALTQILQLSPDGASCEGWLSELMADPDMAKEKWNNCALTADLNEGRSHISHWTPLDALEQAIGRINLLQMLKSCPNPGLARSNLDALRKACKKYLELCASRRSAATVNGFVTYLKETDMEQAQGSGDRTVNVLTYHKAKGLEWPWVVLTGLDKDPRADIFGVNLEAAPRFNPGDPLTGRQIRYWPWPFGTQKLYAALDEKIADLPQTQQAREKAAREDQRLMYVGMTRAKDGLVLAMRKTTAKSGVSLKTSWLDALKDAGGESVIQWTTDAGGQVVRVGKVDIPIMAYEYDQDSAMLPGLAADAEEYLPELPGSPIVYPAARVAPSSLRYIPADHDGYSWEIIQKFNERIGIKGKPEMDRMGSAVHAFLATDYASLPAEEQITLAEGILQTWGMDKALDASQVAAAGQRLTGFLSRQYPGYKAFREWPMTIRTPEGQALQGWMDLLLSTPDGFVVIDHKDHPSADILEIAKKYIPQLRIYKEAVEKATGRRVIDVLLHFPVSGTILQLNKAP